MTILLCRVFIMLCLLVLVTCQTYSQIIPPQLTEITVNPPILDSSSATYRIAIDVVANADLSTYVLQYQFTAAFVTLPIAPIPPQGCTRQSAPPSDTTILCTCGPSTGSTVSHVFMTPTGDVSYIGQHFVAVSIYDTTQQTPYGPEMQKPFFIEGYLNQFLTSSGPARVRLIFCRKDITPETHIFIKPQAVKDPPIETSLRFIMYLNIRLFDYRCEIAHSSTNSDTSAHQIGPENVYSSHFSLLNHQYTVVDCQFSTRNLAHLTYTSAGSMQLSIIRDIDHPYAVSTLLIPHAMIPNPPTPYGSKVAMASYSYDLFVGIVLIVHVPPIVTFRMGDAFVVSLDPQSPYNGLLQSPGAVSINYPSSFGMYNGRNEFDGTTIIFYTPQAAQDHIDDAFYIEFHFNPTTIPYFIGLPVPSFIPLHIRRIVEINQASGIAEQFTYVSPSSVFHLNARGFYSYGTVTVHAPIRVESIMIELISTPHHADILRLPKSFLDYGTLQDGEGGGEGDGEEGEPEVSSYKTPISRSLSSTLKPSPRASASPTPMHPADDDIPSYIPHANVIGFIFRYVSGTPQTTISIHIDQSLDGTLPFIPYPLLLFDCKITNMVNDTPHATVSVGTPTYMDYPDDWYSLIVIPLVASTGPSAENHILRLLCVAHYQRLFAPQVEVWPYDYSEPIEDSDDPSVDPLVDGMDSQQQQPQCPLYGPSHQHVCTTRQSPSTQQQQQQQQSETPTPPASPVATASAVVPPGPYDVISFVRLDAPRATSDGSESITSFILGDPPFKSDRDFDVQLHVDRIPVPRTPATNSIDFAVFTDTLRVQVTLVPGTLPPIITCHDTIEMAFLWDVTILQQYHAEMQLHTDYCYSSSNVFQFDTITPSMPYRYVMSARLQDGILSHPVIKENQSIQLVCHFTMSLETTLRKIDPNIAAPMTINILHDLKHPKDRFDFGVSHGFPVLYSEYYTRCSIHVIPQGNNDGSNDGDDIDDGGSNENVNTYSIGHIKDTSLKYSFHRSMFTPRQRLYHHQLTQTYPYHKTSFPLPLPLQSPFHPRYFDDGLYEPYACTNVARTRMVMALCLLDPSTGCGDQCKITYDCYKHPYDTQAPHAACKDAIHEQEYYVPPPMTKSCPEPTYNCGILFTSGTDCLDIPSISAIAVIMQQYQEYFIPPESPEFPPDNFPLRSISRTSSMTSTWNYTGNALNIATILLSGDIFGKGNFIAIHTVRPSNFIATFSLHPDVFKSIPAPVRNLRISMMIGTHILSGTTQAFSLLPKCRGVGNQDICENQGTCDNSTGICKCVNGFIGDFCERHVCDVLHCTPHHTTNPLRPCRAFPVTKQTGKVSPRPLYPYLTRAFNLSSSQATRTSDDGEGDGDKASSPPQTSAHARKHRPLMSSFEDLDESQEDASDEDVTPTILRCDCNSGFRGERCQFSDSCGDLDCGEHGTPVPLSETSTQCECQCTTPDRFGSHCEKCGLPCGRGGAPNEACTQCICERGYRGELCDMPMWYNIIQFQQKELSLYALTLLNTMIRDTQQHGHGYDNVDIIQQQVDGDIILPSHHPTTSRQTTSSYHHHTHAMPSGMNPQQSALPTAPTLAASDAVFMQLLSLVQALGSDYAQVDHHIQHTSRGSPAPLASLRTSLEKVQIFTDAALQFSHLTIHVGVYPDPDLDPDTGRSTQSSQATGLGQEAEPLSAQWPVVKSRLYSVRTVLQPFVVNQDSQFQIEFYDPRCVTRFCSDNLAPEPISFGSSDSSNAVIPTAFSSFYCFYSILLVFIIVIFFRDVC